jgi:hypothetical protein
MFSKKPMDLVALVLLILFDIVPDRFRSSSLEIKDFAIPIDSFMNTIQLSSYKHILESSESISIVLILELRARLVLDVFGIELRRRSCQLPLDNESHVNQNLIAGRTFSRMRIDCPDVIVFWSFP